MISQKTGEISVMGVKSVTKCAPGDSRVRNVSDVSDGASCLSPECGFSPAFLANGEVREARDAGKTLQEHVKMTCLRRKKERFEKRLVSLKKPPFYKTTETYISRSNPTSMMLLPALANKRSSPAIPSCLFGTSHFS